MRFRKPRRDDGPYLHRENHPPEPPVNVALVLTNGERIAVQCVFTGRTVTGIAHWRVVGRYPEREVAELTVDRMPPKTSISIGMMFE